MRGKNKIGTVSKFPPTECIYPTTLNKKETMTAGG